MGYSREVYRERYMAKDQERKAKRRLENRLAGLRADGTHFKHGQTRKNALELPMTGKCFYCKELLDSERMRRAQFCTGCSKVHQKTYQALYMAIKRMGRRELGLTTNGTPWVGKPSKRTWKPDYIVRAEDLKHLKAFPKYD
jgi:hypothetical protein